MAAYIPPQGRIRSSRSSTDFLIALIFAQTALLSFQSSRFSHTLSFALLLRRLPFRVFNLPFAFSHAIFLLALLLCRSPLRVFNLSFCIYIYIYCCFVVFFFFRHKNEGHCEAPSCKVLYDGVKIGGHIKVMPVHVNQNQGSFGKGLLYHIGAFVSWGKLSSVIKCGLVAILQDQITLFKDSGSNFLVECSLDAALVQLSMAHCGHTLLIYHVQLFILGMGPFRF